MMMMMMMMMILEQIISRIEYKLRCAYKFFIIMDNFNAMHKIHKIWDQGVEPFQNGGHLKLLPIVDHRTTWTLFSPSLKNKKKIKNKNKTLWKFSYIITKKVFVIFREMEKTTKAEKTTIFFVKKISPYISGVNLTSPRSKNLLCFFYTFSNQNF